jgi:hypothetical protein
MSQRNDRWRESYGIVQSTFAQELDKKYNARWALLNKSSVTFSTTGIGSFALLSEQEVSRSWSQIFKSGSIEPALFDRAEQLLEDLRPESPLRHRLTMELEELRGMHARRMSAAAHN